MEFDELAELLVFYFKLDEDVENVYFKLDRDPPTKEDKIDFFKQLPIGFVRCKLNKLLGIISPCYKCLFHSDVFDECMIKSRGLGCVHGSFQTVKKDESGTDK